MSEYLPIEAKTDLVARLKAVIHMAETNGPDLSQIHALDIIAELSLATNALHEEIERADGPSSYVLIRRSDGSLFGPFRGEVDAALFAMGHLGLEPPDHPNGDLGGFEARKMTAPEVGRE